MLSFLLQQNKLRSLIAVMVLLSGTLAIGGSLVLAYLMYFDTRSPFETHTVYTTNEAGDKTSRFRAGDVMLVHRDLCFLRPLPVTFGRTLRRQGDNPVNVDINTTSGVLKKGCVSNANVVRIPYATPPGTYDYVVTVQYSNNPFHDDATTMPVATIEVVR